MSAPEAYVSWINEHLGFNPRAQANSDALSDFVVADLRQAYPVLGAALDAGQAKTRRNAEVRTRVAGRNIDLVIYEADKGPLLSVRISVEHKTIMAAHGKARWNRYGDLIAYSNHAHNHRRDCVAGGVVVVNTSAAYENPDGFARGLQRPKFRMDKVVADTVKIFAGMPLRAAIEEPNDQLEAIAVIVVEYDGANPAKLVSWRASPWCRMWVVLEIRTGAGVADATVATTPNDSWADIRLQGPIGRAEPQVYHTTRQTPSIPQDGD